MFSILSLFSFLSCFLLACLLATSGVRAQRNGARPLLAGCLDGCLDGWLDGLLDGCPLPLLLIFPCSPSYPSSPSFPASCLLVCLLATSGVQAQRSGARPLLDGCLHGCLEGWMAGWIAVDVLLERPENVAPGTA